MREALIALIKQRISELEQDMAKHKDIPRLLNLDIDAINHNRKILNDLLGNKIKSEPKHVPTEY